MKQEYLFGSIFLSCLGLTSAVFHASWQRVLDLTPSAILTSCQAASQYVLNWYFPIRVVLSVFLLSFGLVAVATVLKAMLFSLHLRQEDSIRARKLSSKLASVVTALSIPQNMVIETSSSQLLAITSGLLYPKILVSSKLVQSLTPRQIEAVLLHELHHAQRRHPAWFVLGSIVSNTLWFIPSLRELNVEMRLQLELAADKAVFAHQKSYVYLRRALTKMLEQPQSARTIPAFIPQVLQSPLHSRVDHMLGSETSVRTSFSMWRVVVSFLVVTSMVWLVSFQPRLTAQTYAGETLQSRCGLIECVSSCVQTELMSIGPAASIEVQSH